MPDGPAGLEVVPVLSYPRQAEAGRTYLMTVDLRPSGAASWGAGPAEEVLFRCVLNAYPLFRCEAVGDPSLVCHRFGGTYGPARFLLTAADAEVEGTLRLTLANEWGVPVALYESDPIQVRKAADAAPEPSGLRVVRHEAAPAAGPDTSAAREPALPPTEAGAPGWIAAAAYLKKLFPGRPPLEGELHDAVHGLLRGVGAHLSPPVYYVALHEGWRVGGLVSEDPEQASAERTRTFVPTHGVVEVRPFDEPLLEYALGSSATRLWRDYGKVLLTNGWEFLLLGQDADGQPAVVEHFRLGERPPTRRLPGGAARAAKASELAGFLARVMEPPTPRNLRDHAIVIDARSTLSPGTGRAAAEDLRLFQEWLVDPLGGGLPPANVTVLSESVLSNEGARTLSAFLAGRLDIAGPGRRMYLYLRGGADGISRPEVLYLPQPGQRPHASVARDDLVKGLQARNAFDEWVVLLHCERTWSQLVQPAPIPAWTSPEQAPYPTLFAAEWLDTSSAGGQATRDLVSALDGGLVPGPELANRLRSSPDLSTLRREGPTIVQQGLPDAVMMLGSVGPTSRARVLVRGIDRGSRLIVQRGDDVEVRTGVETFIYLSLAHGRYTLRRQSGQLEIPLEIRGAGVMEVDLPTEPERAEGSRYNFTDEVRRVLTLAREESIRLQHDYVGTEHILLGLLRSPECAGAVLLRRMGLDPGDLRAVVEGSVRRGKATIALGELPYTSRAKKVLEFAMAEQRLAGDEANCTDHLLLGLIREEKGIAAEVLAMRGATLERALVEEVRGRDEIAAARAGETRDEPVQQVRQVRPQPLPLKPPQPVRPRLGRFARESRGPAGGPYNFTDRVRKSLAMAREEAIRLQHDYVGTEHILLGLLRDGEGVGAAVLYVLDVDFDQLFTAAEDSIRRGKAILPLGELPYTSRAKKVLELAMSEARELGHAHVGTEHVLLGLIREEKGIAAEVLGNHGVTLVRARREVVWLSMLESAPIPPEMERHGPTFRFVEARVPITPSQSEPLRRVLQWAEEAARTRAAKVHPEHLLQGILHEQGGTAWAVLAYLRVDEPKLQAAYEVRRARAKTLPDQPPAYSAAASGVLSDMVETAGGFGSAYIGTQHLLLALSRARREVAATLLNDNGVSPEEIIAMLRRLDVVLHAGDDDAA